MDCSLLADISQVQSLISTDHDLKYSLIKAITGIRITITAIRIKT